MTQSSAKTDGSELHAAYASVAEIDIDAPASTVWPHVLDMASWVEDFHIEHASGEVRGEGEVLYLWPAAVKVLDGVATIAAQDRTLENAAVYKTVKLIADELWYAVSMPKQEGSGWAHGRVEADAANVRSTGGFVIWLTEAGGHTRVSAMRTKESQCQSEEVAKGMQESMRRYQPVAQSRWIETYLPRLKALAEASARSEA
jgi:hypothetical protein